ncbi:MAG: PAS domain S-box protein [Archaeoglobales archaeon]|nr:PAS domain S-box protein [Archaeoglobales archaeon]
MSHKEEIKAREFLNELEKNSETYKTILDAFPDFMGIIDSEGKILSVNRSFIQASGMKEEEIIGVPIISFVHPEDLEKAIKLFEDMLKGNKVIRGELRAIIGKKEYLLDVSGRFIEFKNYKFGIVVSKDITEKVRLEKRFREREEFYRKVIDCSISGFLLLERDKIVFVNKTAEEITKYSAEELEGRSIEILFDQKLANNVKRAIERLLNGESLELITRFLRKDGVNRYARVVANLIEKDRGLILVSFDDLTEKRESEKKLEEREILYRTLVESSHTGIFIIQNNKIVYANNKVYEMLGYSQEELSKLFHPYDIISPDFREITKQRYWAREGGSEVPESYEIKVRTKDGTEKWLKVLAKRIKYKGKPAVMVNIADITKLKEDEEALRRMNDLLRVASEIKGMLLHESSEFRILSNLKRSFEKLNAEIGVYLLENDFKPISDSLKLKNFEFLNEKKNLDCILQEFRDDKWFTFIPIHEDGLWSLLVILRNESFTEEELRIISTISHDVSMRLKFLKIEKEKEMALKVIVENLRQFEELADKLRNPLAVIKGYLEIKNEVSEEEFIDRIVEHVDKIEMILDELRYRELATYEMKKLLEKES